MTLPRIPFPRVFFQESWLRGAAGALTGVFIVRLVCEWLPSACVLLWVMVAALAAALLGIWALSKLPHLCWYPLLSAGVYVLWPGTQPVAGAWLAVLIVVWMLLLHGPRWVCHKREALLVFVSFLVLYGITAAPGLLPADSGEFQITSSVLGIPHPPGYPFYTLLGKLATLAPLGSPAWRLNLLSAVFSALTFALLYHTIVHEVHSRIAALAGVLMLGLAPTFWVISTTANIRSLVALLSMACLASLLAWARSPTSRRLAIFGLLFGLGIGHHASIALLGLPFAVFILAHDPRLICRPRRWLPALGAFLAAFLVLLYLPIRSAMQPAFDPAPIRSWAALWGHISASGFGGDMLYYRTASELAARAGVAWQIARLQFGTYLPWLLPLAALLALWLKPGRAALVMGVLLVNLLAALTYRAPQTVEYLLPSYVAAAILLAMGLAALKRLVHAWPSTLITALVLLATLQVGWQSAQTAQVMRQDDTTRVQALALLQQTPRDGVILSNWHQATPLWYLQLVERQRPDVHVEYVYPRGANPNDQTWLERIAAWQAEGRPVVVTNWFYAYERLPERFTPIAGAWQVGQDIDAASLSELQPLDAEFEPSIRMVGYRQALQIYQAQRNLHVTLAFEALKPSEQDLTLFIQLVGPEGPVGQADVTYPASRLLPGSVQLEEVILALLPHAQADNYQLICGFYTNSAGEITRLMVNGQDALALTMIELPAVTAQRPVANHQSAAWANGLLLTGYDVDDSFAQQRRLYLHLAQGWSDAGTDGQAAELQIVTDGQVAAAKALAVLSPGAHQLVAFDLPAGSRALSVRVLGDDGQPVPILGAWHLAQPRDLALVLPSEPQTCIPLAGGITLVGSQVDAGKSLRLSGWLRADQPITRDLSLSWGAVSPDGTERKADSTPAMGAIPALKWGWGWLVQDIQHISLEGAPSGSTLVTTLELYDAFTLAPLQVLDERRVREGQGTRLRLAELTAP